MKSLLFDLRGTRAGIIASIRAAQCRLCYLEPGNAIVESAGVPPGSSHEVQRRPRRSSGPLPIVVIGKGGRTTRELLTLLYRGDQPARLQDLTARCSVGTQTFGRDVAVVLAGSRRNATRASSKTHDGALVHAERPPPFSA